MKYLIQPSTDPYFNMSFDEYCLEHYPCDEPFFYLWRNRPAVIIGLNQNAYSEVNLEYLKAHDIALARRVTGGGAVYHDLQNMNYTFIGQGVTPEPFVEALRRLGVPAELTGRNDIFVEGRKVSGYARRVWHEREIVHGTMMYDVDMVTLTQALNVSGSKMEAKGIASVRSRVANLKDYFPQFPSLDALQHNLQNILAAGDSPMEFSEDQIKEVQKISDEKFSTWEWIYGHSHEAEFTKSAKFACGTVELTLELDRGVIVKAEFGGDFLGDMPVEGLSEALKGLKYEKDEILAVLRREGAGRYFRDTTPEQITSLIIN